MCCNEHGFFLVLEGLHPNGVAVNVVQQHYPPVAMAGDVGEISCLVGIEGSHSSIVLIEFVDVDEYVILFL